MTGAIFQRTPDPDVVSGRESNVASGDEHLGPWKFGSQSGCDLTFGTIQHDDYRHWFTSTCQKAVQALTGVSERTIVQQDQRNL